MTLRLEQAKGLLTYALLSFCAAFAIAVFLLLLSVSFFLQAVIVGCMFSYDHIKELCRVRKL